MSRARKSALVFASMAALTFVLTSCSAEPDVVGIWTSPDGSSAFINEDGSCGGMYYNNGQPLDIGGPMTCVFSNGTLLVSQPPNQVSYDVKVSEDEMSFTSGGVDVVFTR